MSAETDKIIDMIVRHLLGLVKALEELKYKT